MINSGVAGWLLATGAVLGLFGLLTVAYCLQDQWTVQAIVALHRDQGEGHASIAHCAAHIWEEGQDSSCTTKDRALATVGHTFTETGGILRYTKSDSGHIINT